MNPTKILIGLAPWVVFALLTRLPVDGIAGPAAVAAAVASLVVLLIQSRGGVKIIEVTSVVVFTLLAVVGFTVAGGDAWITDYGRATAAFVLAAVMLLSAVTVPFTEQYARESVPENVWHSERFRTVNRTISAMWGGIMLAMAVCHVIAAALLADGTGAGQLLLNWVVPVLLVLQGVKRTRAMSAAARPATDLTATSR